MASRAFSLFRSSQKVSGAAVLKRSFFSGASSNGKKSFSLSPWVIGSFTAVVAATGASYVANKATQGNCGILQSVQASAFVPPKMGESKPSKNDRTFIMIKPDGVQRGLIAEIIKRFEQRGYKLVAMKFMQPTEELLKKHYADLSEKPFFPGLIKYVGSGPVVAMVWEGLDAAKAGRMMLGETNPQASKPGSIRGDFSIQVGRNIVHGSDSNDSAKKEISLWFNDNELVDWKLMTESMIYED